METHIVHIDIDGKKHRIVVTDWQRRPIRDLVREVIIRHLSVAKQFQMDKEESRALTEKGTIQVLDVTLDDASLDIDGSLAENMVENNALLQAELTTASWTYLRNRFPDLKKESWGSRFIINKDATRADAGTVLHPIVPSGKQSESFFHSEICQDKELNFNQHVYLGPPAGPSRFSSEATDVNESILANCLDKGQRLQYVERTSEVDSHKIIPLHDGTFSAREVEHDEEEQEEAEEVSGPWKPPGSLYSSATSNSRQDLFHGSQFHVMDQSESESSQGELPDFITEGIDHHISQAEVMRATNNFSTKNIIGSGGQATVYKGDILGMPVAIKKFCFGDFSELSRELQVLRTVRHDHVVTLIGYCYEVKCVITEFMVGGSLQKCLNDRSGSQYPWLLWANRWKMAQTMAATVLFLHSKKVLHRDLKPANILLDIHGNIKLADMGFAKLSVNTQIASKKGCPGYFCPHYIKTGEISAATDIYSLGIIILQLCFHAQGPEIIHEFLEKYRESPIHDPIECLRRFSRYIADADSSLSEYHMAELVSIGIQCAHRNPRRRPTLKAVLSRMKRSVESREIHLVRAVAPARIISTQEDTFVASNISDEGGRPGSSSPEMFNSNGSMKEQPEIASKTEDQSEGKKMLQSLQSKSAKLQTEALRVILKRAEDGEAEAQWCTGEALLFGWGTPIDKEKAYSWLKKASDVGHEKSKQRIVDLSNHLLELAKKFSIFKSREKKVNLLQKIASDGAAIAQFNIGICYEHGHGVGMDKSMAADWYHKASLQGHIAAEQSLRSLLDLASESISRSSRDHVSMCIVMQSATNGIPMAQHLLGRCHQTGRGAVRDAAKAAEWFQKAAIQGYFPAQMDLAECYERGSGVTKDSKAAFDWFEKAAESDDPKALWKLGLCFQHGVGTEQNKEEAMTLMGMAADQGFDPAKRSIAQMSVNFDEGLTFKWAVNNVRKITEEFVFSETFKAFERRWRVKFYPNGDHEAQDYVSVFIDLENGGNLPSSVALYVHCTITIVNRLKIMSSKKEVEAEFMKSAKCWGFREHTLKTDVYNEDGGFLDNGALLLEAKLAMAIT